MMGNLKLEVCEEVNVAVEDGALVSKKIYKSICKHGFLYIHI